MKTLLALVAAGACLAAIPPHAWAQASLSPRVAAISVDVHEAGGLIARLSPDGRRLAFLMLGSAFVADRETGRAVPVTDPRADPGEYTALAWAPDSRRLALLSGPGNLGGLTVVDVDGGARTTVSFRNDFSDVAGDRVHERARLEHGAPDPAVGHHRGRPRHGCTPSADHSRLLG